MEENIFTRIATGNSNQALQLCQKYGYPERINTCGDLAVALKRVCNQIGEEARSEVVKIHPDYNIIIATVKHNADGDGMPLGDLDDNEKGTPSDKIFGFNKKDVINAGIGAMVVLGIMFVIKQS